MLRNFLLIKNLHNYLLFVMNNFKKKFAEEDYIDKTYLESYDINNNQALDSKINKNYKFTLNNEEEIISTINYKKLNKEKNSHSIHDLRFFQIQNFSSQTYVIICNNNPKQKLLKLLNEISSNINRLSSK